MNGHLSYDDYISHPAPQLDLYIDYATGVLSDLLTVLETTPLPQGEAGSAD